MREKRYWVYILTNAHDDVLYIGVTSDIERRMDEHTSGNAKGFSRQYNLTKLVHLEEFGEVEDAIRREKQLKNWHRPWKEGLIRKKNPTFVDLRGAQYSEGDPESSSG
jgi:putative endonuclease